MEDETLIAYGGAVKALGNGRVGGYLVTFGDADTPDLSQERDFFDATTDYAVELPGAKSTVLYHHGLDVKMGKRRLGRGEMKMDEVGVWIEAQLSVRDEYERAVYEMAKAGKLGWSSGTAQHLVEREPVKNADGKVIANRITHWPLGLDASLTPNPAEPRCQAVALKSLEGIPDFEEALSEFKAAQAAQVSTPGPVSGLTLSQHSEAVVSANSGYAERLETRLEARVKAGRMLSAANVTELQEVLSSLDGLSSIRDRLTSLLEKATAKEADTPQAETPEEPAAKAPRRSLDSLRLQTELLSQQLAGVL